MVAHESHPSAAGGSVWHLGRVSPNGSQFFPFADAGFANASANTPMAMPSERVDKREIFMVPPATAEFVPFVVSEAITNIGIVT